MKIRGHRIEPGEIEHALLRCPGVREALVLPRDDPAGGQRLVAYVGGAPAGHESILLQQLQQVLPAYMVPAAWVMLDKLPLNPNGKIDRAALPAPAAPAAPSGETGPRATDTPELTAVLEILAGLMPGVHLAADDDLFEKGLHSIMMMRFVSQCRSRFGVGLGVKEIYRLSTPALIAGAIAGKRSAV